MTDVPNAVNRHYIIRIIQMYRKRKNCIVKAVISLFLNIVFFFCAVRIYLRFVKNKFVILSLRKINRIDSDLYVFITIAIWIF